MKRAALLLGCLCLVTACERKVTYRVTGTAQHAKLTYTSPGNLSLSEETVTPPWERSMVMGRVGTQLMLEAETEEKDVTLACEIVVNGTVKAEARTTGGITSPALCHSF
jgi:hypothetical protein